MQKVLRIIEMAGEDTRTVAGSCEINPDVNTGVLTSFIGPIKVTCVIKVTPDDGSSWNENEGKSGCETPG